ncbi:hypothetical protein [Streptomyces noursei]|uniref:hypothetical protein n=1 Tax=Streptomyces noursei TaxID=1971 RepID=UPI000C9A1245|nr:hypothetical protein [Streptomyces noursei]
MHSGGTSESSLPGGLLHDVVRVGDTVRRPASAGTRFVGELLTLFEDRGWPGAPRYLGIDEERREILTYLDGHVAWERQQPPAVSSDESLLRVARLVREFHDLTAGTALAGSHEVVCWRGIEAAAHCGDPSMARLRDAGVVGQVQAAHQSVFAHRDTLDRALR